MNVFRRISVALLVCALWGAQALAQWHRIDHTRSVLVDEPTAGWSLHLDPTQCELFDQLCGSANVAHAHVESVYVTTHTLNERLVTSQTPRLTLGFAWARAPPKHYLP